MFWLFGSKPGAATTMLYVPGDKPASVYAPSLPDFTVFTKPEPVFTALISAFATAVPASFVIFPRSVAVVDVCAKTLVAASSIATAKNKNVRLMTPLLFQEPVFGHAPHDAVACFVSVAVSERRTICGRPALWPRGRAAGRE